MEDWTPQDNRVDGTFRGVAQGKPITMSGTLLIEPHAPGSSLTVDGDVEASIPLAGAKIATLVAEKATQSLDAECSFTQRWLAQRRRD